MNTSTIIAFHLSLYDSSFRRHDCNGKSQFSSKLYHTLVLSLASKRTHRIRSSSPDTCRKFLAVLGGFLLASPTGKWYIPVETEGNAIRFTHFPGASKGGGDFAEEAASPAPRI